MRQKPIPIVILGILHILAPALNLVLSAHLSRVTLGQAIFNVGSPLEYVAFFGILPAAGVAILAVKSWSYPVYLGAVAWSFYINFQTYSIMPEHFTLYMLAAVYFVNLSVVTYFLIPAVRAAYFNPRLRWWETKPRYQIDHPVSFDDGMGEAEGRLRNVSVGGVYLECSKSLPDGQKIRIKLKIEDGEYEIGGEVVRHVLPDQMGYGVQFIDITPRAKKAVRHWVRDLHRSGVEMTRPHYRWTEEFAMWLETLVKTGQGWVPRLPEEKKSEGKSGGDSDKTGH